MPENKPQLPPLKPCPFCGAAAKLHDGQPDDYPMVDCMNRNCAVYWQQSSSVAETVKAWNTRPESSLGPAVDMAAFLSTHPALSHVESPVILEACQAYVARLSRIDSAPGCYRAGNVPHLQGQRLFRSGVVQFRRLT